MVPCFRFLATLCLLAALLPFSETQTAPVQPEPAPPKVNFVDIAARAGLNAKTEAGGEKSKRYIIETTGSGIAAFDFDNDGFPDLFQVNGSRLEAFPKGEEPTSHLYRNNRDGTFNDVTQKAGVALKGWGQGVCAGDYDNDGFTDLFVTFWGHDILLHNNGNGTFTDVTRKAGLWHDDVRWSTGCAFLDYNRDGHLDLFVSHYVDFDPATTPEPGSAASCMWKGIAVMCGPRGLKGTRSSLFRNNGDGTFTDVSEASGISKTPAYYCLTALAADFDNDGWPNIFVACDSTPNLLFHNNHDGTFKDVALESGVAYNDDGREQAGMGADTADYDGDGWLDIIKTNFSDDTSTLYHNNHDGTFSDVTALAGLARNSQFLGWGTLFVDIANDGRPDILTVNGHIFPEIEGKGLSSTFRERKLLYWNEGNGRFRDISLGAGPGMTALFNSHGIAAADFDNDGSLEIVVNNSHDRPNLLKNYADRGNWILLQLEGAAGLKGLGFSRAANASPTQCHPEEARGSRRRLSSTEGPLHLVSQSEPSLAAQTLNAAGNLHLPASSTGLTRCAELNPFPFSNRSAIGARVTVRVGGHLQTQEVRSGGGYISQSDFRLHFGLGTATKADSIEIRWPSGIVQHLENVPANQIVKIREGAGIMK